MEDLQSIAVKFINTTASHIFLTGKAGTGKTTFLKNLKKLTYKSMIVVAPTGIAALNAGGVTIHSQFLLPPVNFVPERFVPPELSESGQFVGHDSLARKHVLTSIRKRVLRSIDLLVIDEVSMLRADLLDAIDYRMKSARGNFRQSFGGVQVLFIGDLFQLPPVVKNDVWNVLSQYYKSPWFYEAKALQETPPVYIELGEIFRQSDPTFIQILNNLRNNVATTQDIHTLNQRFQPPEEIGKLTEVITLTTHNYKADEINQMELRNLPGPAQSFDARMEGDFPESMYPVLPQLTLKVGAQIMFVRNDNEDKMYFNGKLAMVVDISEGEVTVQLSESHIRYKLKREIWENKKYSLEPGTHELSEEQIGAFEQYPVKLAWAITVHKSQGLTFDKAIIDVNQAFADGQVYVALSRLRSLDGLVLRSRINPGVISTDKHVMAFSLNNHKPEQLGDVMKFGQQEFIQLLVDRTFDFTTLIKDIRYLQKEEGEEEFKEPSMQSVMESISKSLESEQVNTSKFRVQLTSLLQDKGSEALLDRLRKGSSYYKTILSENIKVLMHHLEMMKRRKRVKMLVTRLEEIDQALDKKLLDVDKVVHLVEAILTGNENIKLDVGSSRHTDERVRWLSEIRAQLPAVEEKKRKPRSSRKSRNPDGQSTYDLTLGLLNAGLTVSQIAAERHLTSGTIEGHLAKAVEAGKISIFKVTSEESVKEISDAIAKLPEGFSSKDLFASLRAKHSYGLLRAVTAHLKSSRFKVQD